MQHTARARYFLRAALGVSGRAQLSRNLSAGASARKPPGRTLSSGPVTRARSNCAWGRQCVLRLRRRPLITDRSRETKHFSGAFRQENGSAPDLIAAQIQRVEMAIDLHL